MAIDFEKLKQELSIERVLQEYGMLDDLKRTETRLYGSCPVHHGDNPRAFNVSLDKNLWNCFTHCGGGSVIDLLMKIEKINAKEAAYVGFNMLGMTPEENKSKNQNLKPLKFRLTLKHGHPYLENRNIDAETAKYFGIGYCSKGIMQGRIAIPIHTSEGKLVAYCGRSVNNEEPKYRFPGGFQKSRVVYNLDRVIQTDSKEIVVTEGFFDVFALYKAGINAVALMGSFLSHYQKKQLLSLEKRLVFMFDGDDAGRNGMQKAINSLYGKQPVKAVYLPDNAQPDHYDSNCLQELVN